jgi:hypothetical protein
MSKLLCYGSAADVECETEASRRTASKLTCYSQNITAERLTCPSISSVLLPLLLLLRLLLLLKLLLPMLLLLQLQPGNVYLNALVESICLPEPFNRGDPATAQHCHRLPAINRVVTKDRACSVMIPLFG